ncbi:MAG: DUF1015 family protein [Actinobacteria bacterium ATB1]|nr:DUF1015 family protein [Actinobacteria bacterium ATB1]
MRRANCRVRAVVCHAGRAHIRPASPMRLPYQESRWKGNMTDQRLAPFRGLLPRGRVEVRTAPPYDVIDEKEAARLRALDPENIVRVDLPSEVEEASLGDASGTPVHDADTTVALAHERAAELLSDWVERGSAARADHREGQVGPTRVPATHEDEHLDDLRALPRSRSHPPRRGGSR